MNKQRLEAFTDGVFAIVITLLILDIKIPDVAYESLGAALIKLTPQIANYVLSFFVVGLYWVANHSISRNIKQVDGTLILITLIWLLFVSTMPFPTSLLGKYPLQPIPIVAYGVNLIGANLTGFVVTFYLYKHPELCHTAITSGMVHQVLPVYVIANGLYLIGIVLAGILPWVSYAIFGGVLIWLFAWNTLA
ncbi:MAG TPA: TMEM175 family protein [Thermoflexales bacterium]|nr:TMEM175 family protein [Thermoflexales bacterium]HQW34685.1 TMEM175 family protein [Thermoflexales bacterium]HQZ22002.1 TMEM175 family protein [Thermoflexales bacterium]HRA00232.1 TMEM175 family protein [Thermoflexales bacterium]